MWWPNSPLISQRPLFTNVKALFCPLCVINDNISHTLNVRLGTNKTRPCILLRSIRHKHNVVRMFLTTALSVQLHLSSNVAPPIVIPIFRCHNELLPLLQKLIRIHWCLFRPKRSSQENPHGRPSSSKVARQQRSTQATFRKLTVHFLLRKLEDKVTREKSTRRALFGLREY